MDKNQIFAGLNEAQTKAVESDAKHLLVLAGAGSGKTRVLVHRIAYKIAKGASPFAILAVTFTNKAAGEMRSRVASMLDIDASNLWLGTFHSISHRMLRLHYEAARLDKNFQILDSDDQLRLIKRILKQLNINDKELEPREVQGFINRCKDNLERPSNVKSYSDSQHIVKLQIYDEYEKACARANSVDFAELLLRTYELLNNNPDILQIYQNRFAEILVDEFQDTNTLQYAWLKLLAGNNANVTVVGDDDQSIYAWRGAKVENIRKFNKQFKDSEVVRLEQNYRSTNTILQAANTLIENNQDRMGKKLWTSKVGGEPITVYGAFDERDEAHFVAQRVQDYLSKGGSLNDIGVLYRSNAQSRIIEEVLVKQGINHRIYGGLRFFDRAEIKDALAYLRLITNTDDDAAFERIINTPKRGLGERSLMQIREYAKQNNISLYNAANFIAEEGLISTAACRGVENFIDFVKAHEELMVAADFPKLINEIIVKSGLYQMYQNSLNQKDKTRLENLEELVNASFEYAKDLTNLSTTEIAKEFLSDIALDSTRDSDDSKDALTMMTLHAAKGLEFPLVFITGLEHGLFPHQMSFSDEEKLEEERRLCYVGLTRAQEKLFLTYAERRNVRGFGQDRMKSNFLKELPKEYLDEIRSDFNISFNQSPNFNKAAPKKAAPVKKIKAALKLPFKIGERVNHPKFGEGVVLNIEATKGDDFKIQVEFGTGAKWLLHRMANLVVA